MLNVSRGQLVPYVITLNNVSGLLLTDVTIVDRYPAGFSYVEGSARLDGAPSEPTDAGGAMVGHVVAGPAFLQGAIVERDAAHAALVGIGVLAQGKGQAAFQRHGPAGLVQLDHRALGLARFRRLGGLRLVALVHARGVSRPGGLGITSSNCWSSNSGCGVEEGVEWM